MKLTELQADLRHFAAERDWQHFHTPKNLSTALMVEAAELTEIFQWMTPEESQRAHQDAEAKERIGEEVADVLLYLLQLADHCHIDIQQAVRDKMMLNAIKHPVTHAVPRLPLAQVPRPSTHILLDYENVQPNDDELRKLVPDASDVWVFHGPHQRQVEQRFASFGAGVTAVPISRTGRNALDFHLSFYLGYIVSRNPHSAIVVVANDQGYQPMLEHARSMGFVARQVGHGPVKPAPALAAAPAPAPSGTAKLVAPKVAPNSPQSMNGSVKKPTAKQVQGKKAVAKKAASRAVVPKKAVTPSPNKAAAKKAAAPKKMAVKQPQSQAAKKAVAVGGGRKTAPLSPDSAATVKKLSESLRKMGDKRPTKTSSLLRSLKSFLGVGATEKSVQTALARLIDSDVVRVDEKNSASYPRFAA